MQRELKVEFFMDHFEAQRRKNELPPAAMATCFPVVSAEKRDKTKLTEVVVEGYNVYYSKC